MKKAKETIFVCANCGNEFSKWAGQCGMCGEWNSLKEMAPPKASHLGGQAKSNYKKVEVVNLGKLDKTISDKLIIYLSTIGEFDRVLGKGIVHGQVMLFAGEPGIGKSTLLTQLVGKIGGLYAAGEESAEQIGMRVRRLGLNSSNFDVLATNDVDSITSYLNRVDKLPKIVVVDSIQVMYTQDLQTGAGSPAQIRECTFRLVEVAKRLGVTIIIVGHVTKEGDIAGPKLLEHMVDTVLYFEGEKNGDLRILRAVKNRFGSTDEVGIFKMEEGGLKEIRSSDINLVESSAAGGQALSKVGAATTILLEGSRPVVVEIQALVVESFAPMPKRVISGIDYNRGQLLIAVAQKVLGIPLYKFDVFLAVTGGLKIEETGADLAIVAAMLSSYKERPVNAKPTFDSSTHFGVSMDLEKGGQKTKRVVFVGEVSLLGEVTKVRGMDKRKKEAEGMGMKLIEIKSVGELRPMVK